MGQALTKYQSEWIRALDSLKIFCVPMKGLTHISGKASLHSPYTTILLLPKLTGVATGDILRLPRAYSV